MHGLKRILKTFDQLELNSNTHHYENEQISTSTVLNTYTDSQLSSTVNSSLVFPDSHTGKLVYKPYNEKEDKILDFSSVGYKEGQSIPLNIISTVIKTVNPNGANDSNSIQEAIDYICKQPAGSNGFRGIVQLIKGTYYLSTPLVISNSGVVIQGDPNGESLLENIGQNLNLINIQGKPNILAKKRVPITDETLSVGSTQITVKHADRRYKCGDLIIVAVQFNDNWVKAVGMDIIHPKGDTTKNNGWRSGKFEHLRRIVNIQGDKITLNSPLTTRLEKKYGGGYVELYQSNRINNVGLRYLVFIDRRNAQRTKEDIIHDEKAKVKDYRFAAEMFDQVLIEINHAENCWVKQVTSVWWRNFIRLGTNTLAITLSRCSHTFPNESSISKQSIIPIVGQFAFEISGQLILIEHCHVENSFHAYSYKGRVPGPNVIYKSECTGKLGDVGPHMKWSSGQLYDNCNFEGQMIIQDRYDAGSGHGWSGANCVVWNTVAHSGMVVQEPPTAQNFLFGSSSKRGKARINHHPWAWEELTDTRIYPSSLYLAQLYDQQLSQ